MASPYGLLTALWMESCNWFWTCSGSPRSPIPLIFSQGRRLSKELRSISFASHRPKRRRWAHLQVFSCLAAELSQGWYSSSQSTLSGWSGGLEGLNKALDRLKRGLGGTKIVFQSNSASHTFMNAEWSWKWPSPLSESAQIVRRFRRLMERRQCVCHNMCPYVQMP